MGSRRGRRWGWLLAVTAGLIAAGLVLAGLVTAGLVADGGSGRLVPGGGPRDTPPTPASARQAHPTTSSHAAGWQRHLRPPLAALAADEPDVYGRGCHAHYPDTAVTLCSDGDPAAPATVLTIGDSHATNWQPATASLAAREHWRNLNTTKSACPVWNFPITAAPVHGRYVACEVWRHRAFALAVRLRPRVVILHSTIPWTAILDARGRPVVDPQARERAFARGLASSVAAVRPSGAAIVVMQDTPGAPFPVAACLEAAAQPSDCTFPSGVGRSSRQVVRAAAVAAGAVLVDPYPVVCPAPRCPVVVGDVVVYRGGGHLTRTYSLRERPWVRSWLRPLLAR